MEKIKEPSEWHKVNIEAAVKLTELTTNPGMVFRLDVKDAPDNFTRMEGACSYYVSIYRNPIVEGSVTIPGEMLIGRTEGDTLKNYGHYFACDADNNVYFTEAYYKKFPGHHVVSSTPIKVVEMFGHGPLAGRTKP
jgi:hypothetical protein